MQVGIVTLFPGVFSALSEYGISGRALRNGLLKLRYWNPRDYATDRHRTVDDRPYGGGPGMLMKTGPVCAAIRAAKDVQEHDRKQNQKQNRNSSAETAVAERQRSKATARNADTTRVIYLSPQGKPLTQQHVVALAQESSLILLCGRYEGVDERVLSTLVDEEYSLGDFVLSGGEMAAMALLDAVIRLLPQALGAADSAMQDSFQDGLLDHPHYTRPENFEGMHVPAVLLSGDHAEIARWRLQQRLGATWRKRPDLLDKLQLTPLQEQLLERYRFSYESSTRQEHKRDEGNDQSLIPDQNAGNAKS